MTENLDELAHAAADALVAAMVTDSWEAIRGRFAALVGHEQRMDAARAELTAVSGGDRDRVWREQVRAWRTRLRDALEDQPGAAENLRGLMAGLGTTAPAGPISQHAHADHASQSVNVRGNIAGNSGEVYVGVGTVDKRKVNIALTPFVFLARAAKDLTAAHGAAAAATIAVVAVGAAAVTGWQAHWPRAVFGTAAASPLRWTAVTAPLPADAAPASTTQFTAGLSGVSCPASNDCLAAGYYTRRGEGGASGFLIETLSRGTWASDRAPVPFPGGVSGLVNASLTGVMCSSPTACAAYGSFDSGGEPAANGTFADAKDGVIENLAGDRWLASRLPLPAAAGRDELVTLWGMACPGRANCIAVGSNSYFGTHTSSLGTNESQAMIQTLAKGKWTPAEAPLPADAASTGQHAELDGVACTTAGACIAVGSYTDTRGSTQALIVTMANGTWSPARAVLPADAAARQAAGLYGISCPSTSTCIAVGQYAGPGGVSRGLIETLGNGTVSSARAPGLAGQKGGVLDAITCPAPADCIAVGGVSAAASSEALVETLASGVWHGVEAPLPANAARSGQNAFLDGISCATSSDCVAVGSYTNSGKGTEGLIETTSSAATKTAAPLPAPPSTSVSPTPPVPSATSTAPSPADSNPAADFTDGTRVEVAGGGGGSGNVHVTIWITAGRTPLALDSRGAVEIFPVDDNGKDPWSSPESQRFYDPSTNQQMPPPDLQPGQSVCIAQYFDDPANPQEDPANISGWTILIPGTNGTRQRMTLIDGGGTVPICNMS